MDKQKLTSVGHFSKHVGFDAMALGDVLFSMFIQISGILLLCVAEWTNQYEFYSLWFSWVNLNTYMYDINTIISQLNFVVFTKE